MPLLLRMRLHTLLTPERHLICRFLLTSCAFFWILLVIAVMGLR